jgi:hypothetical protein
MDIVLRAVVIYLLVFTFTRVLGRRELATLQPFDLILLVVIGDLIQSGVTQNDLSVTGVIIVVSTIGILQGWGSPIWVSASAACGRSWRASRSCWSRRARSSTVTCAASG